ncbi:MAG: 2TM domain-containing protein [Capsulimonadales bacterium]|nr:2TM domain-containing protein [Capsulimonadales bacterium]
MSYSPEEAEAILTRATSRRADRMISHEQLLEMAAELGISAEEVADAEETFRREQEDAAFRREFVAERRSGFWPHLVPFLIFSVFLITMNLVKGGKPWALFPILSWGIGVACHALAALPMKGAAFEREFSEWKERHRRKTQRKARREAKKAAKSTETPTTEEPIRIPVPTPGRLPSEEPPLLQVRNGKST